MVADGPDCSGTAGNPHTTLASMNMQVMAIIQKLDLIWDEFSTPSSQNAVDLLLIILVNPAR